MKQSIQFLLSVLLAVQHFCEAENLPEDPEAARTKVTFQRKVAPHLQNELMILERRLDKLPQKESPVLSKYKVLIQTKIEEVVDLKSLVPAINVLRNFGREVEWPEQLQQKDCSPCDTTDRLGHRWRACPNNTAYRRCKESGPESHYFITWLCGLNGKFVTEKPDNSNCNSIFLEQLDRNLTDSIQIGQVPVKESRQILEKLIDFVEDNGNWVYTKPYFGHDIPKILKIAKNSVVLSEKSVPVSELENIGKLSLNIMLALLGNQEAWKDLDSEVKSKRVTNIIEDMESVAFYFLRNDEFRNGKMKTFPLRKNDEKGPSRIILGNHNQLRNPKDSLSFSDGETSIAVKLSAHLYNELNISDTEDIKYVGKIINNNFVENLLGWTKIGPNITGIILPEVGNHIPLYMNTKLISFTLKNNPTSVKLQDSSVIIKFRHNVPAVGEKRGIMKRRLFHGEVAKAVLGESTCVYWDTQNFSWSTSGCRKISEKSNSMFTVCECNHLSTFAVLTGYHTYYPAYRKARGLKLMTWILCGISMLCLTMSVVIFTSIKAIRTEQVKISAGLCISLIAGNIFLLLADKDNYYSDKSNDFCIAIGIINHYAWLSAFGWMAVQGIHLYLKVVKVFPPDVTRLFAIYCFLAFGVPAVIVAATAIAGYLTTSVQYIYVGDVYCWLTGKNVWAFMGPVLIVITGNFIVLCIAVWRAVSRRKGKGNVTAVNAPKNQTYKKLIIGTSTLTFLLGITWSIGFFTIVDFEEVALVFSYIFTVLNASQGIFIFIFQCILNEKLMEIITSKVPNLLTVTSTEL